MQSYASAVKEHDEFRQMLQEEFSEEARLAFMANPRTVWFAYPDQTREEGLTKQWNDQKERMEASLARKAARMQSLRPTDPIDTRIKALEKTLQEYTDEHNEFAALIAKTFTEEKLAAYLKAKRAAWPPVRSWKYEIDQEKHERLMWDIGLERHTDELAAKKKKVQLATDLLEREKHCYDYAEVRLYGQDALAGYYAVTKTPTHYEFVLNKASSAAGEVHLLKTFTVSLAEPMGVGEFVNVSPKKIRIVV
jgi:hypothetical protein